MNARSANLLGAFIRALDDQLRRQMEDELAFAGETSAALVSIGYNEGRTVEFLRKTLTLSHSGTVRLVEKLVESGMVRKEPGEDRRMVHLHLTSQGRRKMQLVLQTRRRRLEEIMARAVRKGARSADSDA